MHKEGINEPLEGFSPQETSNQTLMVFLSCASDFCYYNM